MVAAAASITVTVLGDPGRPAAAEGPAPTAFASAATGSPTTTTPTVTSPAAPAPTGSLSVTLPDPMTGAPIAAFCVEVVDDDVVRDGCTDTGTLLLADVPAGDYLVLAYRAGQSAVTGVARREVVAGEVAEVAAAE